MTQTEIFWIILKKFRDDTISIQILLCIYCVTSIL